VEDLLVAAGGEKAHPGAGVRQDHVRDHRRAVKQ
jgi:hypothetical protein